MPHTPSALRLSSAIVAMIYGFAAGLGILAPVEAESANQPPAPVPMWIWSSQEPSAGEILYFRREFDTGGVAAARLYIACDDRMTVFLDGKQVLEHSSWESPQFLDISRLIDLESEKQKHVLAVRAENSRGSAGLLARLDLDSGWRTANSVVSNDAWQVSSVPTDGWMETGFRPTADWNAAVTIAPLGGGPWARAVNAESLAAAAPLKEPTATNPADLKVAKGFSVELLHSVPKDEQGSWVNLCVDPAGRLIASDQYGSLYRITPPGISGADSIRIEPIPADIGEAQGLLWAFDSLYVSVNKGRKYAGGLYRVTDSDGDDQLDDVEMLRPLNGTGEHGPHAVLPHPDGKSLVIICGNRTELTELSDSRVTSWDEDLLIPRPAGKFMHGTRAPGGCIYRINPEGTEWELIASGFRNQFDAAFSSTGELFTYDADMEWDINAPWYRPTRICHVVSGAEFGWRSGGGKWPVWYEDSIPPVLNIGPGSPTGVCFGYDAHFPPEYRNALFACDWSYGKLYAVHLKPDGATFRGTAEEFITGTPLPLTDLVINPTDGAMYFAIGGRKVQSGLYRVTADNPSTTPLPKPTVTAEAALRRQLEELHRPVAAEQHAMILSHLGHSDRFVRYAARTALEHQPREAWESAVVELPDATARLNGLLALARSFERIDKGEAPAIDTPIPDWSASAASADERRAVTAAVLSAVNDLQPDQLTVTQKLLLSRVLTVTFTRVAPPDEEERGYMVERLQDSFPTESQALNSELAKLLVYLQAPYAAAQLIPALEQAPTQEEQIDYAAALRHLQNGWTPELRERYFRWFVSAAGYRGGSSFALFLNNIREDAEKLLPDSARNTLKPILAAAAAGPREPELTEPREFVQRWTMTELAPLMTQGLTGRSFENGRKMFAAARCFGCHRFDGQGGAVGPDLTALSGRFSPRDILESVLEPSKQISDQYGSVQIITADGKIVHGRIINLAGDALRVQTDMLKPSELTSVDRRQIEEIVPSTVSMMPEGLLNTLNEEEVLDLMAYLLSRGDASNPMFR